MVEHPTAEVVELKDDGVDLIRQEYFFLQTTVEDYQKQSLDIKKLSIGLSGAIVAFKGLTNLDLKVSMLSVCFLALAFWMLDWLWKEFQRNHYPRLSQIECELGKRFNVSPRISASWRGSATPFEKRKHFELQSAFWPQVWLPHLPIIVVSLVTLHFAT